jgi:hypothetical protein
MNPKTIQDYLAAYKRLHDGTEGFLVEGKEVPANNRLFDGSNFVTKLLKDFDDVLRKYQSVRVLDWGSGKAEHLYKPVINSKTLYQLYSGKIQSYYCYDPGFEKYSRAPHNVPGEFDVVICADVMEHVPHDYVYSTLANIAYRMDERGVALFTISGKKAKKQFIDGENLHICVMPLESWKKELDVAFKGKSYLVVYDDEQGVTRYWNDRYAERFLAD